MQEETILWLPGWGFQAEVFAALDAAFPCDSIFCSVNWQALEKTEDMLTRAKTILNTVEGKVLVVGWSLGAMVALELAFECPEKVSRLVLFSPTSSFIKRDSYEYGWDERVLKRMKKQLRRDVDQVLVDFEAAMFSQSEKNNYLKKIQTICSRDHEQSLATGLDYLLETDLRENIKIIMQPMLLIHGSEDTICPEEASLYMKQHAAGEVRRIILDGAGHIPFITEEERVIRELARFYCELTGSETVTSRS